MDCVSDAMALQCPPCSPACDGERIQDLIAAWKLRFTRAMALSSSISEGMPMLKVLPVSCTRLGVLGAPLEGSHSEVPSSSLGV